MDALIINKWIIERTLNSTQYNTTLIEGLIPKIEQDTTIPDEVKAEATKLLHAIADNSHAIIDNSEAIISMIPTQTEDAQNSTGTKARTLYAQKSYEHSKSSIEEVAETHEELG